MKTWLLILALAWPAGYVVLFLRSARFRAVARGAVWIPAGIVGTAVLLANWSASPPNALFLGITMTLIVWGGLYWQFRHVVRSKDERR